MHRFSVITVLLSFAVCLAVSGCGGGGGSHRVSLTEQDLQQIEVLGADITARIGQAVDAERAGEVYKAVAEQLDGSPGISDVSADKNSLTVWYQCGAVEQWNTPVPPEEPVDFQQRYQSIRARVSQTRLTTPLAKSVWINPYHDQPGEFFQKASALKDQYQQILELCGYDHREVLNSDAGVEFSATRLSNYSVGPFLISDSEASDILGTGFGLTLDRQIRSGRKYDLHATLGYTRFSGSYEGMSVAETLIPLTVRAVKEVGTKTAKRTNRPYLGLGLGLVIMDANIEGLGGSTTDVCIEFVGGMRFGAKTFAELRLLGGGRNGNTGFGLSVGSRF